MNRRNWIASAVALSRIVAVVSRLPPGKCIAIDDQELIDICPLPGFQRGDWVLEHIVGSGYEFSWRYDAHHRCVVFSRLSKPSAEHTYTSPDRLSAAV